MPGAVLKLNSSRQMLPDEPTCLREPAISSPTSSLPRTFAIPMACGRLSCPWVITLCTQRVSHGPPMIRFASARCSPLASTQARLAATAGEFDRGVRSTVRSKPGQRRSTAVNRGHSETVESAAYGQQRSTAVTPGYPRGVNYGSEGWGFDSLRAR
jgi:hypothetical protein